uniref:Uncharacterized protein n=1 Tax=Populus alba TaxID=43335 RepID=A0A4U5PWC2_POPAL|nr:hypothetical protein D5086_0000176750 [Populus alba]
MKQDTSLQDTDPDLWSRVDAIVLQWIYSTISEDLLNTILEHASSYCQHLKSLSDQLSNVGSPIRHGDSLPPFYKARSMLVLEETARMKRLLRPLPTLPSLSLQSPIPVAIRLEIHSTTAPITLPTEAPPPVIAEEVAVVARSSKGRGRGGGRGGQLHKQQYTTPLAANVLTAAAMVFSSLGWAVATLGYTPMPIPNSKPLVSPA